MKIMLAAVCFAATVALAGCRGDDGGDGAGGPEDQRDGRRGTCAPDCFAAAGAA